jgi:hypothetical protein
MREKACRHGNRPAALCGRCRVERERAAAAMAATPQANPQTTEEAFAPGAGRAVSSAPVDEWKAEVGAGGGVPPVFLLDGVGVAAGVTPDVTPPFIRQAQVEELSSADEFGNGSPFERVTHGALADVTTEEEPPEFDEMPLESLQVPDAVVNVPKKRWGRELPVDVRCGGHLRFAVARVGDSYQLFEMVRAGSDETGWRWEDRKIGEPDGYDIISTRMLDMTVEVMSP